MWLRSWSIPAALVLLLVSTGTAAAGSIPELVDPSGLAAIALGVPLATACSSWMGVGQLLVNSLGNDPLQPTREAGCGLAYEVANAALVHVGEAEQLLPL